MDLRRRLLGWLSLLLGGLLVGALLVQWQSLKNDIDAEIAASSRLVDVLLQGAPVPAASAALRHVRIDLTATGAQGNAPSPWLAWLGLTPAAAAPQALKIGDQTVYIAPNPHSEIEERLEDTVRLLITLLFYSAASLLAAWWATDRALRPVRALEQGLQRLTDGEDDPALPDFSLREYTRVAHAIRQLGRSLSAARAAQQALARQLIDVQENERRALSRELHDDMGQTLTALNATAAHLERNANTLSPASLAECGSDLRRDIRTLGRQLRHILKSLRPHGLDASGLNHALNELLDSWRQRDTGIEFFAELPPKALAISDDQAVTLYRIVQEALTNVIRHSGARQCWLRLSTVNQAIRLEIRDDGSGIAGQPIARGGLLGMQERIAMAGGQFSVSNAESGGLSICAALPINPVKEGLA